MRAAGLAYTTSSPPSTWTRSLPRWPSSQGNSMSASGLWDRRRPPTICSLPAMPFFAVCHSHRETVTIPRYQASRSSSSIERSGMKRPGEIGRSAYPSARTRIRQVQRLSRNRRMICGSGCVPRIRQTALAHKCGQFLARASLLVKLIATPFACPVRAQFPRASRDLNPFFDWSFEIRSETHLRLRVHREPDILTDLSSSCRKF